ncbi:TIR domain-containing protein [Spiroplasma endosymbiont of Nebria brevicollis]|uniref:TIR domain-containing protein n=1 Tax=Spiroplasma endosymbiont of Nebria brevicollis TaxID=3066284 RepID=UPI00313F2999
MKTIFITYYHASEQKEKDELSKLFTELYSEYFALKDMSVKTHNIDTKLPDRKAFQIIREHYLKDTDVTIIILGKYTKYRRFVDWEIATSLSIYGSLGRRKKWNDLIILLTDDFIEQEKTNPVFDGKNYSSLIYEQNSGQRIYDNVINGYATVESFSHMYSNPGKLKKLIDKPQDNSKKGISPNNTSQLKTKNEEKCPFEESKFKINEVNNLTQPENSINSNEKLTKTGNAV